MVVDLLEYRNMRCAMCTEVTTDPATLQCNHTFCKPCLLKYTTTQPEEVDATCNEIVCPTCKQPTKVTNFNQLKPNLSSQEPVNDSTSGSFGNISGHDELPAPVLPSESCFGSIGPHSTSSLSHDRGNTDLSVSTVDPLQYRMSREHSLGSFGKISGHDELPAPVLPSESCFGSIGPHSTSSFSHDRGNTDLSVSTVEPLQYRMCREHTLGSFGKISGHDELPAPVLPSESSFGSIGPHSTSSFSHDRGNTDLSVSTVDPLQYRMCREHTLGSFGKISGHDELPAPGLPSESCFGSIGPHSTSSLSHDRGNTDLSVSTVDPLQYRMCREHTLGSFGKISGHDELPAPVLPSESCFGNIGPHSTSSFSHDQGNTDLSVSTVDPLQYRMCREHTLGSFGKISGHDELPAPVLPSESSFGSIGPHSTSSLSHDRGNTDLSVSTVDPLQYLMCREHTLGSFGNISGHDELPAPVLPPESCFGSIGPHSTSSLSHDQGNTDLSVSTVDPLQNLMCREHRDSQVQRYCKGCSIALCDKCCSTKHDGCDVESIQNMIPLFEEKLACVSRQILKKMKTTQDNIRMAKKHIGNIINNAQKVKGQIQHAMKFSAKTMIQEVNIFSERQINDLNVCIQAEEMRFHQYQQQYKYINTVVTAYSLVEIRAIYESLSTEEEDTDANTPMEYRPVPERIVFTQCVNENGDYSHQIEVVHDVSDRKSSAVLHHTIDCHTEEDKWCPDLIDVTVVSSSGEPNTIMIVADFTNRSLKSIYTSKSSLHKRCLKLSDRPWQIAKLHKNNIAVSVPDSKEIVTVQLTPNPVLLSTIRTKKEYFALACPAQTQLLAGTFKTSNSVDLLDMAGHVLKSINTGSIVSPDYIQITDQKNILVGQGDVNSFVSVNSDGAVLFYYPSTRKSVLSCPRGFATTSTGDVLLVDRDCKKVIQLTESGQFVRDVLTEGLEHPRGLCLDNDGLMYVTLGSCVNVFTFKDVIDLRGQGEREHGILYSQRCTEV
ncbi:uncharacterized protein LOC124112857 isoform X2 [Haliotis rufescens]|uniref:uncharacterized protein LOC124112857 isoform X2 n=1 Tax=Haliotis rufescens TaxID=6454 RepID=UPI00201EB066|nr:uncharacterized protein LOC124112857 isoform X2 [Haliotis rufescens]